MGTTDRPDTQMNSDRETTKTLSFQFSETGDGRKLRKDDSLD